MEQGERILDLSYEELVTDPETAWRQLKAHCGLSAARVASLEFSSDYIGVSKPYAGHLQPLAQAMRSEAEQLADT